MKDSNRAKMVRVLAVLVVFSLAGCQVPVVQRATPTTSAPTATATAPRFPDAWTLLRQRPLRLPTLASGARCPAEHARQVTPQFGAGIGAGPAYAALGVAAGAQGVLLIGPPSNFESTKWGGNKVLWYVSPQHQGPILVRGHQLDGPNEVRFEFGDVPPVELAFMAGASDPSDWTNVPSYTRLRAPGCYAYQVDGTTFTEVIVFLAQPA
jgi:hypothetical protein